MPRDHISTFSSYYFRFDTSSGAIQHTVPTYELVPLFFLVSYVAKPKSASFTSPSVLKSILSLLISLCIIPFEWIKSKPERIYLNRYAHTF